MCTESGLRAARPPRPADLERGFQALDDGTLVRFRPISPHDGEALKRFHGRLSQRSIYLRYLGSISRLSDEKAGYFTHLEEKRGFALAAFDPERLGEVIAVVLYVRENGSDRAEYAALVEDRWQGRGLGLGLTSKLIAVARSRGIRRFGGIFLPENARMLNLLRDLDLPERVHLENGVAHVEIDLGATSEGTGT